jgi:G3E family GTPase
VEQKWNCVGDSGAAASGAVVLDAHSKETYGPQLEIEKIITVVDTKRFSDPERFITNFVSTSRQTDKLSELPEAL